MPTDICASSTLLFLGIDPFHVGVRELRLPWITMLGRAFGSRGTVAVSRPAILVAQRTLIGGMASNRIPRGMTPLAVRDSADVVEELASAYVSMDLTTMTAFHKKAMAAMLPGADVTPETVPYEDQLLQAMGGSGGGSGATMAAPTTAAAVAEAATPAAAPSAKKAAEKTAFDVTLKKFPAENKIKLIKELRSVCGLGIQEAKAAIEKCPGVIAKQVQSADAEKLKAAMAKLGAEVELL